MLTGLIICVWSPHHVKLTFLLMIFPISVWLSVLCCRILSGSRFRGDVLVLVQGGPLLTIPPEDAHLLVMLLLDFLGILPQNAVSPAVLPCHYSTQILSPWFAKIDAQAITSPMTQLGNACQCALLPLHTLGTFKHIVAFSNALANFTNSWTTPSGDAWLLVLPESTLPPMLWICMLITQRGVA